MQSTLLSHALTVEFPELAQAVQTLKQTDAHFAKMLADHDDIDKQITQDEMGSKVINDHDLHALKQQRAKLKDALYQAAKAAK
ncbi:MAG: YdcH family protein [Formosimonas sp.]